MPKSNGCRTLLLLIPPLLFLFPTAALISILERISKNTFYSNLQRSFRTGAFQLVLPRPGGGPDIGLSLDFNHAPILVILGICVIAYAVTVLSAAGIWQLKKVEGTSRHERVWVWVVLIANVIMIGVSLGGFGYATSVQASDGTWRDYEDAGRPDQELTRETWACQIHSLFPGEGWAGTACGTSQAMRYLLLPMAVAAMAVLGSLWVLVRGRGGLKWLFGGKGRYAGFRGAYELQPQEQGTVYSGPLPPVQWQGQQGQQWAPQAYQPYGQQLYGQQPAQPLAPQPQVVAQVSKSDANVEQRPVYQ
ncbi:hypothetical protein COCCADRAFT_36413 [Bipolaris zeicola 26-R-13]|uniref:Uncharacterized protein n=1 Tax=Cochliobolus carbonum (strain 26-R-13) TaxID=930089 RepID=W6YED1_COCC2|nr:uncharacterized protein COCCADRAFT_36413 [Bipolaris zeicola 26-R-13]EUC33859.1 hypothetical protein COCCADRAFT_36413 [Bipolaris zeicola 26-R-13]